MTNDMGDSFFEEYLIPIMIIILKGILKENIWVELLTLLSEYSLVQMNYKRSNSDFAMEINAKREIIRE